MAQILLVDSRKLDDFEGLYCAVHGTHVDVMQLGHGRLQGTLFQIGIGDFSLSIGAFNVGVRTRRVASDGRLIIAMLLGRTTRHPLVVRHAAERRAGDPAARRA